MISELNTNISPSVSFKMLFAKPIGPAKNQKNKFIQKRIINKSNQIFVYKLKIKLAS